MNREDIKFFLENTDEVWTTASNDETNRSISVVKFCGGRYACFDCDDELSGVSDDIDKCLDFLFGDIDFVR